MRLRLAVGAIMALLVAGVPATAAELPAPTSHVVDVPDAMDSTMRWATEQQLENFETKSGIHVAVAVIKSPQPLSIEDYGAALFRHWDLAARAQGRTALLVVASGKRTAAIKAGPALTDVLGGDVVSLIMTKRIAPHLDVNDITGAAVRGADTIVKVLRHGPAALQASEVEQVSWFEANHERLFLRFFGGFVIFLCVAAAINIATFFGWLPRKRRGVWRVLDWITAIAGAVRVSSSSESSSRSSGGRSGSFSGGGGSSGGGGASANW